MNRRLALICFAALLVGSTACAPDRPDEAAEPQLTFAPELDVDLDQMTRTPSGLLYRDLREGTGEPVAAGNHVIVHYTGWLPDGTQFDSSRGRQPFDFVVGQGMVIAGWDEGVAGMRPTGRRQLVLPPELAYGAAGAGGVIPPNATLVFDVELLEVH